jgi:hypothetical protein
MAEAVRAVHADELASVNTTGTRQELDQAIADSAGHATDQTGNTLAAEGATQKQQTLRQTLLRDHMAPIARMARARLPQTPEMAPLRMPRNNSSVQRLATAARGMAQAAVPHGKVFIAAGLPADFITQLNAAADALVQSVNARAQHRSRRTTATTGLRATLTSGRQSIHVLDALVKSALKGDPALLAGWRTVKRVQKTGTRSTTTINPMVGPTPAPTPAAADVTTAA